MADRVIQRHDTAARWQQFNPVLASGEIGIITDGARGYKIGDGKTPWNSLPFPANPTNVVQETGDGENVVMSQKAVSGKLSELEEEVYIKTYSGESNGGYGWLGDVDIKKGSVVTSVGNVDVNLYNVKNESSRDYVTLVSGKSIAVPFDVTAVRATSSVGHYEFNVAFGVKADIENLKASTKELIEGAYPKEYKITTETNLLNQDDDEFISGYYLDANGQLVEATNYAVSGYIVLSRITPTLILTRRGGVENKSGGFLAYYDGEKRLLSTEMMNKSAVATWFEGAAYVRFSISYFASGEHQVSLGTSPIEYTPYGKSKLLKTISVSTNNIESGSISPEKLSSNFNSVESPNLLNLKECKLKVYAIVKSDGTYTTDTNDALMMTPPIKVKPNTQYSYTMGHSYIPLDKDMKCLVTQLVSAGGTKTITTPSDCEYLVINYYRYRDDLVPYNFAHTNRLYEGNIVYPYTPYGVSMGKEFQPYGSQQVLGVLGADGLKLSKSSLSPGEEMTFKKEVYPYSLKENQIVFSADISEFGGGIQIGRGFTSYNSGYFKITSTSVSLYRYEGGEYEQDKIEHGLNISEYVKIAISERNDTVFFVIQTLQGVFAHEFNYSSAYNGHMAVKSLGAIMTNCVLGASNKSFKKQIWMFGDSYYGADYNNRQLFWLKSWGFLNALVQGYAGQGSKTAYEDLEHSMSYGAPKYVIWSLGMNDDNGSELADITTGDWYKYFVKVKQLCELNGITLIATTIPEVRSANYKNKDKMSGIVRNSGLRYIDTAKAVGSNAQGQWYGDGTEYDYQSTDNVHPSKYGASAIATQFLIDFPELMQY